MTRPGLHARRAESGLTIIELMVAMLIATILLAGLVTIFASMRRSFSTTRSLNQLVNQQQFASTVLTNAISSAGYYPVSNRTVRGKYPTTDDAFPVDQTLSAGGHTIDFATAGQFVYGTGGTSKGGNDVVAVRMINGASTHVPYDCLGNPGTPGTASRAFSVFWVDQNKNQLMCATSDYPSGQPLLGGDALTGAAIGNYGGVTSLTAEYGVDINRDGSVDRYMSAATLNSSKICADTTTGTGNTSSCWPYVRSVRFTLGFITALNDAKSTIYLSRTVRLNNTNGMTLASMSNVVLGN